MSYRKLQPAQELHGDDAPFPELPEPATIRFLE